MGRYDIALGKNKNSPKKLVHKTGVDPQRVAFILTQYLHLRVDNILNHPHCDAVIFGGAIRDCIAFCPNYVRNQECSQDENWDHIHSTDPEFIHDVDIMALPRSAEIIAEYLISTGFEKVALTSPDLAGMYIGIKKIHEPWTFIKSGTKPKIVQIIRPVAPSSVSIEIDKCIFCGICQKRCPTDAIVVNTASKAWLINRLRCIACSACVDACPKKCLAMENMYSTAVEALMVQTNLLSQVDISACGVFYDGRHIVETHPGAIEDCLNKQFRVLESNAMYQQNRIIIRIEKLEKRGWKQYS